MEWRRWVGLGLLLALAACGRGAAAGGLSARTHPDGLSPAQVSPSAPPASEAATSFPRSPSPFSTDSLPNSPRSPTPLAPGPSPLTPIPLSPTAPAPFQLCSPLALHSLAELAEIVSDPYRPPPPGHEERHHGVDFSYYRNKGRASIQGEGVQAVLGGQAAMSLADSFPYGNVVIIETPAAALPAALVGGLGMQAGESLYLLYAHMEAPPLVKAGEAVSACQPLGAVGKSGNAGVAHLHLETRLGPSGQAFPGMQYYTWQATGEEKAAYLLWRTSGRFRHINPFLLLGAGG